MATLAGIYSSVPVPVTASSGTAQGFAAFDELPLLFDARGRWADAAAATQWAFHDLHPLCDKTASLVVLQACHVLIASFIAP